MDPSETTVQDASHTQSNAQIYYFAIGAGRWTGGFTFRITSWRGFLRAEIGLKDHLLLLGMWITQLLGKSRITSDMQAHRHEGVEGVASNVVRISKLGVTLYLVTETYTVAADGSDISVQAHERFGPVPFLLNNEKRYTAVIHAGGMSSTYHMPLLGSEWIANYTVATDRAHVAGHVTCSYAECQETIHKVGEPPAPTDRSS